MANTSVTANENASQDALALLDQWASGVIPNSALNTALPSLSQQQLKSLWDIVSNPSHKQTLSEPFASPR
jgi:hypothetical protein